MSVAVWGATSTWKARMYSFSTTRWCDGSAVTSTSVAVCAARNGIRRERNSARMAGDCRTGIQILRNDAENMLAPSLVDQEVPPIKRKNHVKVVALGQIDQRGVRELRAKVFVFFHQLCDLSCLGALEGEKLQEAF